MKPSGNTVSIAVLVVVLVALSSATNLPASVASSSRAEDQKNRTVTFADRVAYQYAIEEVYWRHRIWPKENARPKPSLDEVMSAVQVEKKVRDYLRDSQLLEYELQRPITPEQLQAEVERMAKQTRLPEVLGELFEALGNDPAVIAECLGRQVLTQRLVAGLITRGKTQGLAVVQTDAVTSCVHTTILSNTAYTLPIISGNQCTDDSWTPTSVPEGRENQTAVWTGSEMIVWGGYNGSDFLNSGGRYNPSTDSWTTTSPINAPAPRGQHTAIWTGSEMIVWGGTDGVPHYFNSGGRYNPATDAWIATTITGAPAERETHTAVWTGNEMIVWGGYISLFSPSETNTGGRYSPATDTWSATSTTNVPAARGNHTAIWIGNEMIIWGGYGNHNGFSDGGRYKPSDDTWSTMNSPPIEPRRSHTAIWTGSEMIVWGGHSGNSGANYNNGARYNPVTDGWIVTTITGAPTARSSHTAVWSGNEMIVWGGNDDSSGSIFSTGGRYNPVTGNWTATSTADAPSARWDHTAIWTGSEMIVWGGFDQYNLFKTGGRYDPSTNSWTATSAVIPPAARQLHTAIWTGSEMIVWGGHNTGVSIGLNTGGRYDPATDSWTPTGMTNAADARESHTAIWTGSEMIVWGGFGGSSILNTGGRYNPTSDSWTATTTSGAPTSRAAHTAVWSGNEMIVWGGSDSSGTLNTGGRYNPSSDSWSATTTTVAPTARSAHTAVWTGNEVIVWGGSGNSGNTFRTGGRYNPSGDSWTATTTSNAPTSRSAHTAVWTGNEVIVWGGYASSSGELNTGGKYNPGTNSWTATTTSDAPTSRQHHTAIWSGSEMIVWGGLGSSLFNTGGRYNPETGNWTTVTTTGAPGKRYYHTAIWTGSEMIIWGGDGANYLSTGGIYCAQPSTPIVQNALSRKMHGSSGTFDVTLPLTGTPGIECRSGGAASDYTVVVTFLANVSVSGSPQAAVTLGAGMVGTGGLSNGGAVTVSGNVVTIPLTSVTNTQTINVTLSNVNGSTDVTIPMSILVGDTNGNGTVNSSDVGLVKSRIGQAVSATNFRSDVNVSGSFNASDVAATKSKIGTGLP